MGRATKPIEERLWSRVEKRDGGCWLWQGAKTRPKSGYGTIRGGGRAHLTHRLSWELANGPIPDGLRVLHKCDVPLCVNPAHLFLGTQRDNMEDMAIKGRHKSRTAPESVKRGELHPLAKLTRADAEQIRSRRRAGATGASLAREFGVSEATISLIVRGKRWA